MLVAACGSNTTTSPPSSGGNSNSSSPASGSQTAAGVVTISTMPTNIGTVLVNSKGHVLYWFAKDTPTKSNCTGSCLTYWPPVTGTPKAAPGSNLPMGFGTIKGANGEKQVTYDGHPLYTYAGDTSKGETSGNGKNLSGGLWWAMTPSGKKDGSKKSSSGSGGSGGYGY